MEEDKKDMMRLEENLDPAVRAKNVADREAELKRRLAGHKVEDKGDDQLLGEAVKLQYNKQTKTAAKQM